MKLGFSQQEIINTAKSLGLPSDGFVQRRVARAYDLVNTNKVTEVTDGIFRVRSQYEPNQIYLVNLNHGAPSCDCPDGERTINCKHRIASLLYAQKQAESQMLTIYDDSKSSYLGRGRWIVTDPKAKVKYIIYRDNKGNLHCPCRKRDCEHRKAIRDYLNNGGGNAGKRISNECGTQNALEIQQKLNSQLNKSGNNGNGATGGFVTADNHQQAPSHQQLDIKDPFQESELLDIAQIEGAVDAPSDEGRSNGELVHKLSNGEYVISYRGIMTLSEKHHITFEAAMIQAQSLQKGVVERLSVSQASR